MADHAWLDGDAGPLIRPYTLTGGRVRPSPGLDLVAHVVAGARTSTRHLTPGHRRILDAAATPTSVAEVASRLDLALSVVRIMLGHALAGGVLLLETSDLIEGGLSSVHEPSDTPDATDPPTLEAVIHVLRQL